MSINRTVLIISCGLATGFSLMAQKGQNANGEALLALLCYKQIFCCRIVLWANRSRQAHRNDALRHISMAWRKPQGTLTETFR
jgi:hypothetical protein